MYVMPLCFLSKYLPYCAVRVVVVKMTTGSVIN